MEILLRFQPLMAEAMHCAGTQDGLSMSLEEISARLVKLADEERSISSLEDEGMLLQTEDACREEDELRRFAVYAWIDERMLGSDRPDAFSWVGHSLQARYFRTTEGGRLFYEHLSSVLDRCGVYSTDNDGEFSLAERLESVRGAAEGGGPFATLRLYAFCLLYGFQGELGAQGGDMARVRQACKTITSNPEPVFVPTKSKTAEEHPLRALEPLLWFLLPVIVCIAYYFWCACILSDKAAAIL